jgi:hypothetical protein
VRVDQLFRHAARVFDEAAAPFHLAVTQLEHAEWLSAQERPHDASALLVEARATFESLGATPWVERAASLGAAASLH